MESPYTLTEEVRKAVGDLSPEDQQLFWPEIQLTPAEKLSEKLSLMRRELSLLKEKLSEYQGYMSLLPIDDHMLLRGLRVCNYDHQEIIQTIQCVLQLGKNMNLPEKPPSVSFGTPLQTDELLYAPEIWSTPSEQIEEKLPTIQHELQCLKDLLRGEKYLDVPRDDDFFLLRFLRSQHYKHQRAFRAIKMYFRIRAENPDIFEDFLPSKAVPTFPKSILGIGSRVDSEGKIICFNRFGNWNVDTTSVNDYIKCFTMALETISLQPAAQIFGVVVVVDLKGLGLNQVRHYSVAAAKLTANILQYYIPLKIKAIYYVNEPAVFSMLYNIIKPFLGKQARNMIHFLGSNLESLHKHIPPEVLPSNYGGKLKPLSDDGISEVILQEEMNFQRVLQMGYH